MTLILTIIGLLSIFAVTLWIYGLILHRLTEQRDEYKAKYENEVLAHTHSIEYLETKLGEVPLSIRNHYSK